jgi:hypothetical protein
MRELTIEELREVNGGMRGNPGGFGRAPYLPRGTEPEPEHQHVEYPLPQHAPSVAQGATCGTLVVGAGLMAIPLGPPGMSTAMYGAGSLCEAAFKNAQR